MSAEKPKPCPFCGSPGVGPTKSRHIRDEWRVECEDSGDTDCWAAPIVYGRTPEEAIRRWNTRRGENR